MSCPIVSPTTYTWPLGHESILTLWEGSKHIHFGARKIEIETLFPIPKDQLDNLLASCVVKPYINELLFKEAGFNFLCQLSTENPEITQIQNCYEQRKQLFNRCIADTDAALAGYKVKRIFLDDIEWNYKEKLYDEISYTNCKKYYHYSFRISGFCYPNTISFSATKELKSRAQQDILKILDHLYSEEASFEEKRKQLLIPDSEALKRLKTMDDAENLVRSHHIFKIIINKHHWACNKDYFPASFYISAPDISKLPYKYEFSKLQLYEEFKIISYAEKIAFSSQNNLTSDPKKQFINDMLKLRLVHLLFQRAALHLLCNQDKQTQEFYIQNRDRFKTFLIEMKKRSDTNIIYPMHVDGNGWTYNILADHHIEITSLCSLFTERPFKLLSDSFSTTH